MTDHEITDDIVAGISDVFTGRPSHCVLMAISVVLGRFVAHGQENSLPSLMKLIEGAAASEEVRRRAELVTAPVEHVVRVQ